jgi:uncharacterized membrane protein
MLNQLSSFDARSLGQIAIWAIFFASSVYGHVALKLAVTGPHANYREALWSAATSFWGWSTVAAWGLSCLMWVLAISNQKLLVAGSISSLSYALICGAAWIFLGERVSVTQCIGIGLIMVGIVLVK